MSSVQRLIAHPDLRGFVESVTDAEAADGDLSDLMSSERHVELVSLLKESISVAFEAAEDYKDYFNESREFCRIDSMLDVAEMRASVERGDRGLDEFREDLDLYIDQTKQLDSLVESANMGILSINTKALRALFLPFPKQCMDNIFNLLPQLASERYQNFINEVHDATAKLSSSPGSVEEFVAYIEFMESCLAKRSDFDDEFMLVTAYYELIEEYHIQVPDIDHAAFKTLPTDFNAYKGSLDFAEGSHEERVIKFSSELEREVEGVGKEVADIRVLAGHEMILDGSAKSSEVIELTTRLVSKVEEQKAQAKRIQKYQRLFKVFETSFEDIDECSEEVTLKHTLWTGS